MRRCRSARTREWRLAPLFFCLALARQPAQAEYAGRMYYIDRPKLGIELAYRLDTEERTGPFGANRLDSQILSERIDLETEGWVYHPAMAQYTLRLSPEWRQGTEKTDPGRDRSTDTSLLGYGLDVTLLPYKPYTVNLYARRQSTLQTTTLAPTSEAESEAYGASLRLKYKVLPTYLSYDHSTTEQTGFYTSHEVRDELRLNMRHEREASDTRFDLAYGERERTTQNLGSGTATVASESLQGSLLNNYRLTPDNRVLLSSLLSFRQTETGVLSNSGLLLSETLNWRHTRRLSSNYNLQYSRDDNDGRKINRTFLSAGLSHFLYENLTTSLSLSGSSSNQGDSNYGGSLNLAYQRRIPGGMVFANIGQDYRVNKPSGGLIRVTDSFSNLPAGDTALLSNLYVVPTSISVTDDTGTPLVAGIDYEIIVVGASTQIKNLRPVPTSFVVTYDYQSPTYDSSTHAQSYGIGLQLWDAWRINYRYNHSQQEFLAGIRPEVLPADTRHSLDTDLRWRWSTTRFLYEDSESTTGLSMTRWRVEENLSFQTSLSSFLGAAAYYGETTLKETGAEDRFYGARADYQRMLGANSRLSVEALYAVIDGSTVKTVDKGVATRWEWTWGIWRADAAYRYLVQEDQVSGQTRNRHTLFIGLRRALF